MPSITASEVAAIGSGFHPTVRARKPLEHVSQTIDAPMTLAIDLPSLDDVRCDIDQKVDGDPRCDDEVPVDRVLGDIASSAVSHPYTPNSPPELPTSTLPSATS